MHGLNTALGMPQHRFASVHVVGTNGKSSVTRMTAALLDAHGLATGACVSPHSAGWAERILIHGETIGAPEFAAAAERVADAATIVSRAFEEGEEVTQFEIATAIAFVAFVAARVDVAVIEAGLGGRLDATNTIPSKVTVLTSVGLDHTEWLGETEEEIAAEKLAVLRAGSTLVLGRVSEPIAAQAERFASERGARLVVAPEDPGVELRSPGPFQRRNFALAVAAAEAFLGELDPQRVAAVAAEIAIPGRLERIGEDPPTFLDAAHNPDGARALAEALSELTEGPVVACLAVLADKDAGGIIAALAPALAGAICTEIPAEAGTSPGRDAKSRPRRSWTAAELVATCEAAGLGAKGVPDFAEAVGLARDAAAWDLPGPPFRSTSVRLFGHGSRSRIGTSFDDGARCRRGRSRDSGFLRNRLSIWKPLPLTGFSAAAEK
jgi:dihydrofolate synthase/folylpolyglutamate synthase